jgi:hypothetical protein
MFETDSQLLSEWFETTHSTTYAGYYMDQRDGGVLRVGFTANQEGELETLENALPLVDTERLRTYQEPPSTPYLALENAYEEVGQDLEGNSELSRKVQSLAMDEAGGSITVGAVHPAEVEGPIRSILGQNVPVTFEQTSNAERLSGRFRDSGRMRAGDQIRHQEIGCTAGFGAHDNESAGPKSVEVDFVITAGHCFLDGQRVWRYHEKAEAELTREEDEIGKVTRRAYEREEFKLETDGEAIRLLDGDIVPRGIWSWGGELLPTKLPSRARVGDRLCFSGAYTEYPLHCGPIIARERHFVVPEEEEWVTGGYWVEFKGGSQRGDSGSPVWKAGSGRPVGILTAEKGDLTLVEPLLHPPNMNPAILPGILHDKWLEPISLKLGEAP